MNYNLYIEKLAKGEIVQFRPKGNSMTPRIKSGELVTISPVLGDIVTGDIVFCKVKGSFYVHLVKTVGQDRFLIGNNHGRENGWIYSNKIFGKVVNVEP